MTSRANNSPGWVHAAVAGYQAGRPLVLLFDYDGTLTPIVRHPSLALLSPAAREVLARLTALPAVTGAVLSGRALDEVKSRVGFDRFYYAGSGGLEIDLIDERRVYPGADTFGQTLTAVHERLLDAFQRYPGTWVERKPAALAVHYRGLLPLSAACFRLEVGNQLATVPGVRFRVVSEAIEVTPAGGWDKGTAVTAVLDRVRATHPDPLPVYFGDSANDTEGMAATAAAGGLVIGVGDETPDGAGHLVPHPATLLDELITLHRRLVAARGEPPPDDFPSRSSDEAEDHDQPLVLVVDQDAGHRTRVSESLQHLGWRVRAVAHPDEAERVLDDDLGGEVRAVLVDLDQPGLTGGRVLAGWGEARPQVVRCGMARVTPRLATVLGRMSGIPVLTKPLDPAASDRQLRTLLDEAGVATPSP